MNSPDFIHPSFWRDRPVFVTGGTGLLGGWLVKSLVDIEAEVVCLVRDWTPKCELAKDALLDSVRIVRGDVCDQILLERVLGEYEVDTVFHLAAQTIVPIANRNPISTFESNIHGTWSLLEACRRSPMVKHIVVASSDKAYGASCRLPYTEDMPLAGRAPYDASKSCADLIAASYAQTFQLPVLITRCGNLYGGGDLNWNRIVPGTIRSLLRGQRPVIRSNGRLLRDYFYVLDGVFAYMSLVEGLARQPELRGIAFNYSNEQPLTVIDLVARIQSVMGTALQPEVLNQAVNEIEKQYLNASKARERLNWVPCYSLEQGLVETVAWYRDYFKTAQPSGDKA